MNESRFDAWTRRRMGLALGGSAVSPLGWLLPDEGAARKGKRKRCRRLGVRCDRQKDCCRNRRCTLTGELVTDQTRRCCHAEGACRTSNDCCRPFACNPTTFQCEVP